MPAEVRMPQLSDTMTEGTLVKWRKKEGDKIKEGDIIADVETDKATMEMEAFEAGTLAATLVSEGQAAKVGSVLALIAVAGEDVAKVKAGAASAGKASAPAPAASKPAAPAAKPAAAAPSTAPAAKPTPAAPKPATPAAKPAAAPAKKPGSYQFDIIVIGGGPAGYAAAIRAGQLKKRVLCIEKENLGGTCLNWGCIPTKALLESGAFVRKLRTEAGQWGVSFDNLKVDFNKIIGRSRDVAGKLSKGIAHLFRKYDVKHEMGMGTLLAPHRVRLDGKDGVKEITAEHIVLATGARARSLPGVTIDGHVIITAREAMVLPKQPARLAVIGAGAIGCEFADFYNALGTEVTIIELQDHLLPIEDDDTAMVLERSFTKRGIKVYTKSKTDKVQKTDAGATLSVTTPRGPITVEADIVLMAVGVTGNVEGLAVPEAGLELIKNHVKVDKEYHTNVEDVWAVGDIIGPPWLAHVAHHEAVHCIEHICGHEEPAIDYTQIPGCTYTHPQVASMGKTERALRAEKRAIKVGKFPFSASGRAQAAGETEGFVKLIFDETTGELLGVHMVGDHVTELLSELVLARNLEATETEILQAMHPHPTLSEAVMEAAGLADNRAIHL